MVYIRDITIDSVTISMRKRLTALLLAICIALLARPALSAGRSFITCDCTDDPCSCFIQKGDEGQGVRYINDRLAEKGYLQPDAPRGEFTYETEAAVRRFQRDNGLEETGVIDPVTLAALYYDRASVEEQLAQYPLPAIEE